MATLAADSRSSHLRTARTTGMEKENMPPPKTKKIVNINAIFDKSRDHRAGHVLSPRLTGISKTPRGQPGYFARQIQLEKESARKQVAARVGGGDEDSEGGEKGKKRKPFRSGIIDAIKPYAADSLARAEQQLATGEKTLHDLQHDVENGKPAPDDQEEFDRLTAEIKALDIRFPADTDTIRLSYSRPDGEKYHKTHRIGDLMDRYHEQKTEQEQKIKQLQQEVADIVAEIENVKKTILEDDAETKKAVKEYEAEMASYEKEIQKVDKQAKAEEEAFKKEQKAAIVAFNQKMMELWESI